MGGGEFLKKFFKNFFEGVLFDALQEKVVYSMVVELRKKIKQFQKKNSKNFLFDFCERGEHFVIHLLFESIKQHWVIKSTCVPPDRLCPI